MSGVITGWCPVCGRTGRCDHVQMEFLNGLRDTFNTAVERMHIKNPVLPKQEFRCHCCASIFETDKPQSPDRDTGFGTCPSCLDRVAESWFKDGGLEQLTWFRPYKFVTRKIVRSYFDVYA